MRAIAFIIFINLLALSVCSQELIIKQNVKLGDYIHQYALIEYDKDGAVYKELCDSCSCYITLSDETSTKYVTNAPMKELETGLFGYNTASLIYGKLYTAKYTAIHPSYGNSSFYGEVLITDKSEWVGDVQLNVVTNAVIPKKVCSGVNIMDVINCQVEGTQTALENWSILGVELGILGTIIFYVYIIILVLYNSFMLIAGGFFTIIQFIMSSLLALFLFITDVLDDNKRDTAIMGLLEFLLLIILTILKPFIPFFVIGELFIVYEVLPLKDPSKMMLEFFNKNYRMVNSVMDLIIKGIQLVFGLIK